MHHEILMAGFGGQGIMLMGQMLAYAGMKEDRYVSWMPSYGPEQRGGTANCGVVLSDEPVGSPVVTEPTLCVVMNRPSLLKFRAAVDPGGYLFINSSLADDPVERDDIEIYTLPVTDEADALGNPRVANMIMLGAMSAATDVVPFAKLKSVLSEVLPAARHNLIPINEEALDLGKTLVEG